ncbi:MAG: hypothetical protein AB3N12_01585 [Ruegeria sp.]
MLPQDPITPGLVAMAIASSGVVVWSMYRLFSSVLDRLPPVGRNADPKTQDNFYISLQRNRETQERMGQ